MRERHTYGSVRGLRREPLVYSTLAKQIEELKSQHEKAAVPVNAFGLNDYSVDEPTGFEYQYINDGIKYTYGFSATTKKL